MKKIVLILLLTPFISFAQWEQLGADIDGENEGDDSGTSISLNAEGNTIAVGAPSFGENETFRGQTRIFDFDGANWTQRGENIEGDIEEFSGDEVSLDNTGNTIAVGYKFATNSLGIAGAGIVKIFDWDGSAWVQRGNTIDGEGNPVGLIDAFGNALSLNGDGTVVAIGATGDDSFGTNSGHVQIHEWNGTAWVQRGNDIDGTEQGGNLGNSVSINEEGTVVAIGARRTSNAANRDGLTRIYEWDGISWIQRGEDIIGDFSLSELGSAVSISASGDTVALGAPGFDPSTGVGNPEGIAKVYDWDGTAWIQRGSTLVGLELADNFGTSLSLNNSGNILAVGASQSEPPGSFTRGSLLIYQWDGTEWIQQGQQIYGEDNNDFFGNAIALNASGSVVAGGSFANDGNGQSAGHARVFQNLLLNTIDIDLAMVNYYPNPVKSKVNFSAKDVISSITIYNILGTEIASFYGNNNELIIDLSNQASGSYFAKIILETNTQVVKIIKN